MTRIVQMRRMGNPANRRPTSHQRRARHSFHNLPMRPPDNLRHSYSHSVRPILRSRSRRCARRARNRGQLERHQRTLVSQRTRRTRSNSPRRAIQPIPHNRHRRHSLRNTRHCRCIRRSGSPALRRQRMASLLIRRMLRMLRMLRMRDQGSPALRDNLGSQWPIPEDRARTRL